MNKMVYRSMSVIVALALTLGVYFSAGASSASVLLMSPITYYVSVTGNDANPGSQALPWKTISKVNSANLQSGDSVLFKRGDVWTETVALNITKSGAAGSPITFGAYGSGNLPVLDGSNQTASGVANYGVLVIGYSSAVSYVTIENLEITNGAKQTLSLGGTSGNATNIIFQNSVIHANRASGYMLVYAANHGALGSSHDIVLRNNHFYDSQWNCIRLTGGMVNVEIYGNEINDCSHNGIDTYPTSINNKDFEIYNNNIHDFGGGNGAGIYAPGSSYFNIHDNSIHDATTSTNDTYGVKVAKVSALTMVEDNIVVKNNRIWNINTNNSNTYALWMDNCTDCVATDNLLCANKSAFLNQTNTRFVQSNNLVYSSTSACLAVLPTDAATNTPTKIPTYTPFSTIPVPSASATPTLLPTIPTATASPVPVLPTATRISVPTATSIATLQPASPTPPPAIPTTAPATIKSLDIRVAKGINDVEESTAGIISTNSADLELVNSSGPQKVGIRFSGVGIPQGATIVNAYIQFKVGRGTTSTTTLSIQGDASANAPAFASTARNVSSRLRTTNIVNWSPSYWSKLGAMGPAQSTPNLAPVIQEIVNQPGWASGNSMAFIITGSGKRIAKSYDGDTTGAPRLHIEYTTNTVASNNPAPLAMAAVVSKELPTALPVTATLVSTPTATFQPPTSPAPVLPTFTATTESINTISVVNVQPVITSNGVLSIAENTTAVSTVTATDANLPAQVLTYSISGGPDSALFSINPSSGELTFITAPDFEFPADTGSDNLFNITVQASDGELTVTQDMAVSVTAVNENNPVITSNGVLSIAENSTAVAAITATDADQPAQALTYSISGGPDSALFSINPSSGELTFVTAPDFELPADAGSDNVYNVTVQASDGELTVTQDIAVSVTAVNENNPVVTSNGVLSIAENTTSVTTVTATDADLPAQPLTYSISGGADSALFSINPSTGELTFITAPDSELPADTGNDNIYNITIQASDGELTVTQDIAVSVTNVNENNPVITSNGALSIPENTTAVATVTATDIDLPAQPLTYSISGGADSAFFSINPSTGELTFITAPDYEAPVDAGSDNNYNVTVQVSDGEFAVTQDIAVSVTAVNENNPVITSNGVLSIAENTTAVSTVTATDADLPAQILTYSISGGPDSALLSINSSSGELTFITSTDFEAPVDAGSDNIYNVTVQASDGELAVTQDITVSVTALNDNNPAITSNGVLSIAENTTAVATVTATDADQPAQTLTYSISGGPDSALFSINSSSGELTFITAPDFELPTDAGNDNVYNITVQTSDGERTATQDIAVSVTAVNENNPAITSNGVLSIAENTTAVTTVTATDADQPAQALTYSISGGVDSALFSINPSTGELTFITAPDFEVPSDAGIDNVYNVTVQASDGELSATQDVAVTVKGADQIP